jgi:rubrerythrin
MKTKTLTFTSITTIALVAMFAFSAMTAFAAEDNGRRMRPQFRDDVQEARQDMMQDLTDEQKEILEEAHELRKEGNHEAAKALIEELGITPPRAEVRGEFHEEKQAVRDAIKAGDYDAFLAATADGPVDVQLTEEQFEGLAEIHELREEGDHEAAKELAEELGLPKMGNRASKRFAQSLTDEQKETLTEAHELAQDGDKEAAKELLEEAGIEMPMKKPGLFKRIGNWFRGGNDSE